MYLVENTTRLSYRRDWKEKEKLRSFATAGDNADSMTRGLLSFLSRRGPSALTNP
jgi:hypothetical protein